MSLRPKKIRPTNPKDPRSGIWHSEVWGRLDSYPDDLGDRYEQTGCNINDPSLSEYDRMRIRDAEQKATER